MGAKRKKFDWDAMDRSERLGYIWLILFWLLVFGTAFSIMAPAYKKWKAEGAAEEKKTGSLIIERPLYALNNAKERAYGLDGVDYRTCKALCFSGSPRVG